MQHRREGAAEAFAALIRERRTSLGHTQEDLAELAGVSARTIVRWENAQSDSPDTSQLYAVTTTLAITLADALAALRLTEASQPMTREQKQARLAALLDEAAQLARELGEEDELLAGRLGS